MPILGIDKLCHPTCDVMTEEWEKWRLAYAGGADFIREYLKKYSARESDPDFAFRKDLTYSPSFSKSALIEFKNTIGERAVDITRTYGTDSYQRAVKGEDGGVDMAGSTMNRFMCDTVLNELLPMGKVGIFVDMPKVEPGELLSTPKRPYLYLYPVENIQNWVCDEQNEYRSVLLKDYILAHDEQTGFPTGYTTRYRRLWIQDGVVYAQLYNENGTETGDGPTALRLRRIPFVIVDIGVSLMADIADYQIALLNLASADMMYAIKSNLTFYVEQFDPRSEAIHTASNPSNDGTAASAAAAKAKEIRIGSLTGRRYPIGAEAPQFINPSAEPLEVSMKKQEQLKLEIRQLLNLAISSIKPTSTSAESKKEDSKGLESGLSNIGARLETAERQIEEIWFDYENNPDAKRATISYPANYNLRTNDDRRRESNELADLMPKVPSKTFQRELAKNISEVMLKHRVSREKLETIYDEIDKCIAISSDPKSIQGDVQAGYCDYETAAVARGYPPGTAKKAKEEHAEKLAVIAENQAKQRSGTFNGGARGVNEASANPTQDAKAEKAASREKAAQSGKGKGVRGDGK